MQFLWPQMLWFLLAVPALVAAYVLAQRRRHTLRPALRQPFPGEGCPGTRARLAPPRAAGPVHRRPGRHDPGHGPAGLGGDPARPGGHGDPDHGRLGLHARPDLEPTRLDAAKAAARAFVDKQPAGVRVGVVSFSDSAFVVQAPTNDKQAVLAAINRLVHAALHGHRPRPADLGGRHLRGGQRRGRHRRRSLRRAQSAWIRRQARGGPGQPAIPTPEPTPTPTPMPKGEYQPAIMVLLSDGQSNQGPRPLDVVQQVADRGIRVYTVGHRHAAGRGGEQPGPVHSAPAG